MIALVCAAVGAIAGCASQEKELERVAKDWCQTIRASQVVPVYPLTEDLQPGDVFLVQRPIQAQAEEYKRRGFLPLDQMVVRLHDLDYDKFYAEDYWDDTYAQLPHHRPTRAIHGDDPPPDFPIVEAPRAGFPSYTFEVRRGVGLKLAIPVQGVPIGFGFMRSDSATGSVTISDAYTYAGEPEAIYRKLQEWAGNPDRQDVFKRLRAANYPTPLFLRVVQRVYLTGGVVVSLISDSAGSTGIDVGAAPEVSVLDIASGASTGANFEKASDALSGSLRPTSVPMVEGGSKMMPGGSLRIVQATARSVTMKENFDRPLVIGYLGYDFPIREDGSLGVPVATISQLEDPRALKDQPAIRLFVVSPTAETFRNRILTWLTDAEDGSEHTAEMRKLLVARWKDDAPPAVWILSASVKDLGIVVDQLNVPE